VVRARRLGESHNDDDDDDDDNDDRPLPAYRKTLAMQTKEDATAPSCIAQ
jgi:hypothetical protein